MAEYPWHMRRLFVYHLEHRMSAPSCDGECGGSSQHIQDLKREVDTIKKTHREAMLEIETLGKKSGTIDASISNRIQEMQERISGAEYSI